MDETGRDTFALVTKLQIPSLRIRINTLCCCSSFYNNSAILRRVTDYKLSNGDDLWLKLLENVLIEQYTSRESTDDNVEIQSSGNISDNGNKNMYSTLSQIMNKCGDDYYKNKSNPLGIIANKLDFVHLANNDLESTLVNEILLLSSFEGIGVKCFRFAHPLGIAIQYIFQH